MSPYSLRVFGTLSLCNDAAFLERSNDIRNYSAGSGGGVSFLGKIEMEYNYLE